MGREKGDVCGWAEHVMYVVPPPSQTKHAKTHHDVCGFLVHLSCQILAPAKYHPTPLPTARRFLPAVRASGRWRVAGQRAASIAPGPIAHALVERGWSDFRTVAIAPRPTLGHLAAARDRGGQGSAPAATPCRLSPRGQPLACARLASRRGVRQREAVPGLHAVRATSLCGVFVRPCQMVPVPWAPVLRGRAMGPCALGHARRNAARARDLSSPRRGDFQGCRLYALAGRHQVRARRTPRLRRRRGQPPPTFPVADAKQSPRAMSLRASAGC